MLRLGYKASAEQFGASELLEYEVTSVVVSIMELLAAAGEDPFAELSACCGCFFLPNIPPRPFMIASLGLVGVELSAGACVCCCG